MTVSKAKRFLDLFTGHRRYYMNFKSDWKVGKSVAIDMDEDVKTTKKQIGLKKRFRLNDLLYCLYRVGHIASASMTYLALIVITAFILYGMAATTNFRILHQDTKTQKVVDNRFTTEYHSLASTSTVSKNEKDFIVQSPTSAEDNSLEVFMRNTEYDYSDIYSETETEMSDDYFISDSDSEDDEEEDLNKDEANISSESFTEETTKAMSPPIALEENYFQFDRNVEQPREIGKKLKVVKISDGQQICLCESGKLTGKLVLTEAGTMEENPGTIDGNGGDGFGI